ncbi:hypothetical protein VTN02DRAFT_430 [Thermoascus thermophilus]
MEGSNGVTAAATPSRMLEGKLAVISGAARAIARNLASKGCSLILNYRSTTSDQLAAALAAELHAEHQVRCVPVRADITSEADCAALIDAAKEAFRGPDEERFQIDIVINNAGIGSLSPLGSIRPDHFHEIMATNVLGAILLTQACLPYLPHDRSGRIVNVSSIGSFIGMPCMGVYAASKGALESMTKVWAAELAERATVNAITPGPIMTDLFLGLTLETKKTLAQWNPLTPLSRVNDSDTAEAKKLAEEVGGGRAAYDWEVAGTVGMLCSPDCRWTTGSVVSANGGLR